MIPSIYIYFPEELLPICSVTEVWRSFSRITNLEVNMLKFSIWNTPLPLPKDAIVFIMRSFYRHCWESTKFKLATSAQDYGILNLTKLKFYFHCFICCIGVSVMWWYLWFIRKKCFSLTEHVVTFSVWQMVLVVKQTVYVHTFNNNRFHDIFSTELFYWCNHYLASSYLIFFFLLFWRHNNFSANMSSKISFVLTTGHTIWRWHLYMKKRRYFSSRSLIFMTSRQKNEMDMNFFYTYISHHFLRVLIGCSLGYKFHSL